MPCIAAIHDTSGNYYQKDIITWLIVVDSPIVGKSFFMCRDGERVTKKKWLFTKSTSYGCLQIFSFIISWCHLIMSTAQGKNNALYTILLEYWSPVVCKLQLSFADCMFISILTLRNSTLGILYQSTECHLDWPFECRLAYFPCCLFDEAPGCERYKRHQVGPFSLLKLHLRTIRNWQLNSTLNPKMELCVITWKGLGNFSNTRFMVFFYCDSTCLSKLICILS